MDTPQNRNCPLRLEELMRALQKNQFEAHMAADAEEANQILCLDKLRPAFVPLSISWGGAMTFTGSGLFHSIKARCDLDLGL